MILFIVNPSAGVGTATDLSALIEQECQAHQPYQLFISKSTETLWQDIPALLQAGQVEKVVIAGGDGTIMEALPLLIGHPQLTIGLLPTGSGNLLARNLGIPIRLQSAIQVILNGKTRLVDIGKINQHLFILNAGVGIDAEIMAATPREEKQKWGVWAYLAEVGRQLFSRRILAQKPAKMLITADGTLIRTRAIGVVCFNAGSEIGAGLHIAPDVAPDDGLLHGSILRIRGASDFILGLWQVLTHKRGERRDPVRHFRARHIHIETTPTLKAQADGNVIGETPVTIEMLPQKMRFLVP